MPRAFGLRTANQWKLSCSFSAEVARRAQETRWYRSEQIDLQSNGTLIWQARIAEPKEMVPWIRSWSADCEVLAPTAGRDTARRGAEDGGDL